MDAFFASPDLLIYRNFREACFGKGSTVLRGLTGIDPVQDFARSTAAGLACTPPRLECRFLYDAQGSILFEQITQQPEYYLTRTESSILAAHADRVRQLAGPATLVELGSGNSEKTDHLLRAWLERTPHVCYVPVDVSESALLGAGSAIAARHDRVKVVGVNCDFQQALPLIARLSPALVLLLGSTIGNFAPAEMSRFIAAISSSMQAGDFFLLGVDLVKPACILEAAYNDAAGVTASFTRNIFARMNRELGCSIDTDSIEHVAKYNGVKEQVEISARFTREQTLFLAPLDRRFTMAQGEQVQIEISRKFRLERLIPYLKEFGFTAEEVFTDELQWFALLLLRRLPRYLAANRRGR